MIDGTVPIARVNYLGGKGIVGWQGVFGGTHGAVGVILLLVAYCAAGDAHVAQAIAMRVRHAWCVPHRDAPPTKARPKVAEW
jgi:hypothetical protein